MSENTKDWGKIKEACEAEEHEMPEAADEAVADDRVDGVAEAAAGEDVIEALEHPAYEVLEAQLTTAEQKASEYKDKFIRLTADMDNLRRRSERDVTQAHQYGLKKFIDNLLPVVDSLEQAEQLANQHGDAAMHEGLGLTMKLFLDMLQKANVEQLNPIGDVFNPELHEAMSMQETADAAPNTIITVFQKGYKLNDRVIRAARVIVAKEKTS